MSKIEVDKVIPQSGTALQVGEAGDTVNIVGTLQNNGAELTGDISSVVAGTGLAGGGTTGDVTLNIEAAQPTITSTGTLAGFTSTGIDDNATSTAMTIDSSNNVGIGRTSAISGYNLSLGKSTNVSGEFTGITFQESTSNFYGYIRAEDNATPNTSLVIGHTVRGIVFKPSDTERVRMDGDGIKFNGDTAAANGLNDYEEGTFTPTFVNQSGGEASNYTNNSTGQYVKIGKMVYVNVAWNMGTITTGPGSIYAGIGGFPFVADGSAGGCPWYTNIDVPNGPATFQISNNFSHGIFYSQRDNQTYNTISPGAISSNDNFQITFVYKTD